MQPIISIVGKSGSGKTTLLEGLIAELKQRGRRVATVKHSHHELEFDTPNKDSWRFIKAGSEFSAVKSSRNLAVFRRSEASGPAEIADAIIWDYDLMITEGFKGGPYPKIEVHRREQGQDLVAEPGHLLAVVTDEPLEVDVPQFSRDEIPKIADLIEGFLSRRPETDIDLMINDEYVPLDPALQNLLVRTLAAMAPGRKEDGNIKSLHLSLRRKS